MSHDAADPAPWLVDALPRLLAAPAGPVLDLACGGGRNGAAVRAAGRRVVGLDRNLRALRQAADRGLECALADLETESGIPLGTGTCAGILVFRFLHRSLAPEIERVLAPGGLLAYETFTTGQRELGHGPRRDAFLLRPGELPGLFPGLEPLAHEEGTFEQPRPQAVARLLARRPER